LGVLHPEVMNNFDIPYAASSVEINAEVFLWRGGMMMRWVL
jgi:phenylalanyl-tRNA synthetase beta chain